MTSHWREGRGCGATWKQKKSRLVTGGINNSECSISKVEFYEAPEDKVTPERENNAESSSFMRGEELGSRSCIFYFASLHSWQKKRENLCAQSQNEVKSTPKGSENLVLMYFLGIWRTIKLRAGVIFATLEWNCWRIECAQGTCEQISWLIRWDSLTPRWPADMCHSNEVAAWISVSQHNFRHKHVGNPQGNAFLKIWQEYLEFIHPSVSKCIKIYHFVLAL